MKNKKLELVEKDYLKKDIPDFSVGDTVRVHLKVVEAGKTRIQVFEGVVIRRKGRGTKETFSVLKEVRGDTVEKTLPINSPTLEKVEVSSKESAKRARLYNRRKKKVVELRTS